MKLKFSGIILSMALMFAIMLGFIPGLETAMTVHASGYTITCPTCGNISWTWEEDKLTIFKSEHAQSGDMCSDCVIADKDYYEDYLVFVTIEDGVTSIGDNLFASCEKLTDIKIPDSVTVIGEGAFLGCSKLTSITIPNGVETIEKTTFKQCTGLERVIIPDSVTYIGDAAFCYCVSLATIKLPQSLTHIGAGSFVDCTGLASIIIPENVNSLGFVAFNGCSELKKVTLPCGLREQLIPEMGIFSSDPVITYSHPANKCVANNTTDTLKASCSCGEQTYTATLKAPTKTTYTGKAIVATCTNNIPGFTPTITYSGNNLVNGKPVNSGTYAATLTYDKSTSVSLQYTIRLAPAPAKPHKITNVVSGVHVYWPAVTGISKYGLWRSETGINGTYKWIANPTVAHFTDTKVESGKTYYYKVTTLDTVNNVHSAKSAAIGITYVATPDITLRVNRAAGIGLGWDKIPGATGYAIYRKPYDGNSDWVRVTTITDPNTLKWDDTSVKTANGTVYRYTIRALAGSNRTILSGCRATGRTMVRLTSRDLNSATKTGATSIKCTWGTTTQATGYEVRFMVGNTVYKTYTIGNYKTGVKTFTDLKAGQTYKIQVRTYKKVEGVGSFYSAWSTAKTVSL